MAAELETDTGELDTQATAPDASLDASDDLQPVADGGDTATPDEDRGLARDPDTGRFAKRATEPGSSETIDGLKEGETATAPPPVVQAGSDVAATAPAPTPPAPNATATPFVIRAGGQSYQLDGSSVNPDGSVVLTPEGAHLVHQQIGQAIYLTGQRQQIHRDREAFRAEQETHRARTKPVMDRIGALLDLRTPEDVAEWAVEFWQAKDTLRREMEWSAREAQLAHRERALQPDPEQEEAQFTQQLVASAAEDFQALKAQPWAKGLTETDWQEIAAATQDVLPSFVVTAKFDGEHEDLRKGERALHSGKLAGFVQKQAQWRLRERQQAVEARKQTDAAARSNTTTTTTVATAPPGVRGATKPNGAPAARQGSATTTYEDQRAAWRREMGIG